MATWMLAPTYMFYPPNTAANRPATGWFLFPFDILTALKVRRFLNLTI
ncbi:hypothetical protein [Anabaena azotica]|uniref:Uncharacterized protein n=1 Tax=Anabaena azotica FACHB-119 TaxID=947527 RepID=A0ABR8D4W7_9NOST|nr:hypothetical protein [Anabaena azotica]MBD2501277.1 hypothetical protein [Anabaena azotica FACHB-119]